MPEMDPAPRPGCTLSVSRSLQALAVVVVVLIVATTIHQLLTGGAAILADTEHQMARLDMVFAEQTRRAVETVDFILRQFDRVVSGAACQAANRRWRLR